ncbi:alpha/beta hydrolase [Propionibacteriaceae bacterium Y1685]|uniref:alpha/beta hydrolase n=1 Tax=Microlunatus sp. Y1700 TaxID=3418487 RepID=UPI003B817E9C
MINNTFNRRRLIGGAAGLAAVGALGGTALGTGRAYAADNGHGLTIVSPPPGDGRLQYYRFRTAEIGWDPAAFVLLPEDYHTSGKRYPVLYWLHGGVQDFRSQVNDKNLDFMGRTAGKDLIVVFPDGGHAGWYCNPVTSNVGPRNWESFHMNQLLPWVDQNFRTHAEFNGRAVAGFSMGGHGAIKYAAKYYGHFASVSVHSGPTSLRRDGGAVVHWANASAAGSDLAGGMVYGAPWDEKRVSMDNAMENVERFRGRRVFLSAGTSPEDLFGWANEIQVLAGQREFKAALAKAGIQHEGHEEGGGHFIRPHLLGKDLDGIVARLRRAG